MKSILYVALPSNAEGQIQIAQERGDRLELIHHRGPFGPSGCIAFAPSTAIGHFRALVPARNEADAARAALYAIEDELAQPVEDIHLVLGPRMKDSPERDIYVVDRSLLKSWIDLLSKSGLAPEKLMPEQCLFTDIDHPVDMGDRIIQREGNRIVGIDTALPQQARDALSAPADTSGHQTGQDIIRLAERSRTRSGVNLRTGVFALSKDTKQGVSAWRKAAGIAIAAISIWTGTLILEARNYQHSTELTQKRAAERYSEIFPAAAIPTDIDRATRDMLAVTTTPDNLDFRTSVAALYEAVAMTPDTLIVGLHFNSIENRLTADLNGPSAETVGGVIAFLQTRGFEVTPSQPTDGPDNSQTVQIILEPVP
ncbi:MAG: type II secretion system protein GspL [Hyphomonas sp.]